MDEAKEIREEIDIVVRFVNQTIDVVTSNEEEFYEYKDEMYLLLKGMLRRLDEIENKYEIIEKERASSDVLRGGSSETIPGDDTEGDSEGAGAEHGSNFKDSSSSI